MIYKIMNNTCDTIYIYIYIKNKKIINEDIFIILDVLWILFSLFLYLSFSLKWILFSYTSIILLKYIFIYFYYS
jgi:hypothetical protein